MPRRQVKGGPAAVDVLLVGVLESGRRPHLAVVEDAATGFVTGGIQRREHLFGELARLVENGLHQLCVDLVATGQ